MLGQILVAKSQETEQALTEYHQAVEFLERVIREHPELSEQAFELALVLADQSNIEQMAGKLDSALASMTKAVEILDRLQRRYPGFLRYEQGLANAYSLTSDVHRHRHETAEAIASVQKGKAVLEGLIQHHPAEPTLRIDLARSQNILGRLLEQTGEPVEALHAFQRAIDLYESLPDLDPPSCYNLASNIALSIPLIGVKNGSVATVDASRLSKGDQLRRQRYGERAVEVLRKAAQSASIDLDLLRTESDLDSIRDRPDFQSLLDELEKSAEQGSSSIRTRPEAH